MNLTSLISSKQPVLLDGAMGTQLAEAELEMGGQANIEAADEVLRIHQHYADCRAQLLITNTLTMNRVYIETHGVGLDVETVNLIGAKLAKSAAGENHYVLGDISSTGRMLEPLGDLAPSIAYEAYKEQARILAAGGVDGFIIETMFDLQEALCALRACREVESLPVVVSMAFCTSKKGGRTIMGNSAEECARALTEAGACVVGANCGDIDPFEMAEVISLLHGATSLPIVAQPNAGKPRLVGRHAVFDLSPSEFAAGIAECIQAGARLVGGCCGTSPAHIRAIADEIDIGTPSPHRR
jgi:5-methyltetrahydrofolate--homocysteine methyltransferase